MQTDSRAIVPARLWFAQNCRTVRFHALDNPAVQVETSLPEIRKWLTGLFPNTSQCSNPSCAFPEQSSVVQPVFCEVSSGIISFFQPRRAWQFSREFGKGAAHLSLQIFFTLRLSPQRRNRNRGFTDSADEEALTPFGFVTRTVSASVCARSASSSVLIPH